MSRRPPADQTFLELRQDWLRVDTIDRGDGSWDIALIIDGTYRDESWVTKAEMVAYFAEWLAEELGQ